MSKEILLSQNPNTPSTLTHTLQMLILSELSKAYKLISLTILGCLTNEKLPLFIGSILHYYKFGVHQQFCQIVKVVVNLSNCHMLHQLLWLQFPRFQPCASSKFLRVCANFSSFACLATCMCQISKAGANFGQFVTKFCQLFNNLLYCFHSKRTTNWNYSLIIMRYSLWRKMTFF